MLFSKSRVASSSPARDKWLIWVPFRFECKSFTSQIFLVVSGIGRGVERSVITRQFTWAAVGRGKGQDGGDGSRSRFQWEPGFATQATVPVRCAFLYKYVDVPIFIWCTTVVNYRMFVTVAYPGFGGCVHCTMYIKGGLLYKGGGSPPLICRWCVTMALMISHINRFYHVSWSWCCPERWLPTSPPLSPVSSTAWARNRPPVTWRSIPSPSYRYEP